MVNQVGEIIILKKKFGFFFWGGERAVPLNSPL